MVLFYVAPYCTDNKKEVQHGVIVQTSILVGRVFSPNLKRGEPLCVYIWHFFRICLQGVEEMGQIE